MSTVTPTTAPSQRWFQFSLRSGLLLMFLSAVLFAWYANGMSRYRSIVRATTQLQNRGAIVEWHLQGWPRFDEVTRISMRGTQPTAEDLTTLGSLSDLAWISLARTPLEDRDLQLLEGLVNLQELDLSETRVTDEGIQELAQLPWLSVLKVGGTGVTPAGAERLRSKLPGLEISLTPTQAAE